MIITIPFYTRDNWDDNIAEVYAEVIITMWPWLSSSPVLRQAQSPVAGRHAAFPFLAWSKQWIIDAADDC